MTHELVVESHRSATDNRRKGLAIARQSRHIPERLVRQFWTKVVVAPSGCWEWTGATDKKGYGRVRRDYRNWLVTRWVWTELKGPIPAGQMVLHHCDNPPCCKTEPDERYPEGHLYLGSAKENMRDLLDRHPEKIEERPRHPLKLTVGDVRSIRAAYRTIPNGELGQRFGVSDSLVSAIGLRRSWKWLDA
jgi:hypothetical protein